MRLRTRSRVDLPQPDGPIIAVTWRSGMSRSMLLQGLLLAIVEVELLAA